MDSRERPRGLELGTPSGGASKPIAASHSAAGYLRAAFGAGAYLFTGLAVFICAAWFLGMLDRGTILSREDVLAANNNAYTVGLERWLPEGALSEIVYPADSNDWPALSSLEVREDGHLLSPAHALHADIVKIGAGRYSHWNGYLIFSTSDNSDPNTNGRTYRAFIGHALP